MSFPSGTIVSLFLLVIAAAAQDKKAAPDTLVFTNGEKLIGKLVRSINGSVTFHSDSVGDITVDWAKVKELTTSGEYAVIGKGTDMKRAEMSSIPQGKLSVSDQKIEIARTSGGAQVIPVTQAGQVIDENTFESSLVNRPGFFEKWTGAISAGAALVQATQSSHSYTGAMNIARAIPLESFLERQSRTAVNASVAYGNTRQPGVPNVKTEIFHADAEQDYYYSPRAYGFGQAAYDHNFSQGLDLQQTYGLGIGLTVVKQANEELNIKMSAGYEKQQFSTGGVNQNLFGSIFSDTYLRKFGKAHSTVFQQQLQLSPAWSNLNAYSAVGSASLTAPVYKRMSFVIGVTDAFVNNPPPGFRKNSFQANTGLTYTLR